MTQLAPVRAADRAALPTTTALEVRRALLNRVEIALLDVREEAIHADCHPLFAANLPVSRIELDAYTRLPRRSVPVVVFDSGEGYAALAAKRLQEMGYTHVSQLSGGLQGWRDAGYEIFRDVNSPSKAFGELVESRRHTPSLSAQEVEQLIESRADIVIVDARRYDEFQTMSIPTALSAPGGELVYRMQALAERPATRIIVNCAGRTRSILGTQSLINAGLPNPVAALRNGTIGWKLASQRLDHGASRAVAAPDEVHRAQAATAARRVADRAKVRRASLSEATAWRRSGDRTVYLFDVRTPDEFAAGHIAGFRSAPGGQLVQETDAYAPVRGARLVLADDDGARANMTASWLAQMNWEVYVVDDIWPEFFDVEGLEPQELAAFPLAPSSARISPETLLQRLQSDSPANVSPAILDFATSRDYQKAHIPGAWFALRSRIRDALDATSRATEYVVTAPDEAQSLFAWKDLSAATGKPVYLLTGGTEAWVSAGYPVLDSEPKFASEPVDRYQRPYEGTGASAASMQAYLDWEFGLVDQLERDSSHGFWVLEESSPG
jgi:rhodanese-related sulfurtransferase